MLRSSPGLSWGAGHAMRNIALLALVATPCGPLPEHVQPVSVTARSARRGVQRPGAELLIDRSSARSLGDTGRQALKCSRHGRRGRTEPEVAVSLERHRLRSGQDGGGQDAGTVKAGDIDDDRSAGLSDDEVKAVSYTHLTL